MSPLTINIYENHLWVFSPETERKFHATYQTEFDVVPLIKAPDFYSRLNHLSGSHVHSTRPRPSFLICVTQSR